MRLLTFLVALLLMSSCVLHSQYIDFNNKFNAFDRVYLVSDSGDLVKCDQWVPPYLPPMPNLPTVPDRLVGNSDAEQQILIKSLKVHREYIQQIRKITRDSYDKYITKCRGKSLSN